jgi:hypothetical protein
MIEIFVGRDGRFAGRFIAHSETRANAWSIPANGILCAKFFEFSGCSMSGCSTDCAEATISPSTRRANQASPSFLSNFGSSTK